MQSRYQQVKDYLLNGLRNNQWQAHERIPSENELVAICGVSRMTARRAIKELESEGLLFSVKGKGTFVTPVKAQSSAVALRNIADEIKGRQHRYHCEVLSHSEIDAPEIAELFAISGQTLFHSLVIHYENDIPLQMENRYVNPQVGREYLSLDLQVTTANEYLTKVCPVTNVEHQIEAVKATTDLAEQLMMSVGDPCLKLTRLTRDRGVVVSLATLYHPGDRFKLGTEFEINT